MINHNPIGCRATQEFENTSNCSRTENQIKKVYITGRMTSVVAPFRGR